MEKRRNATIDFIRIIASILVIAIHTTNGIIAETIGRWAVPFFMVVTGYFYFLNPNHDRLIRIIKNLLALWLVWMVVYIPNGIYSLMGLGVKQIISKLIWSIIGFSVFYVGSWYLPAAAFGIWVVDYLNKRQLPIVRNLLAAFSLFLGCVSSSYAGFHLGKLSTIHWCDSIFIGILWMTLAYYIAKYHRQIQLHFHSFIWIIVGLGLTLLERFLVLKTGLCPDHKLTDMYITLPISIVLLFGFVLGNPWHVKQRTAFFFRNFATLLFFTQFMFLPFNIHNHAIYFTFTLIGSVVLSLLILWLSKFKHLTWLQRLYN